ncbi:unnamed protein product [Arabidopsis thaliana]|uniref:(thale cress) hypothetical protein n=1 Tax=Arabidopsis thaliana TaxID=3702 RepID=A0A7G2FHL7_ARATH|nr:unnamed protein product [Arabidopsis thaliana]
MAVSDNTFSMPLGNGQGTEIHKGDEDGSVLGFGAEAHAFYPSLA